MDFFSLAPRALYRRFRLYDTGRRIALCKLQLAQAETALGLLGWQQADFDHDTQRQVDEIQKVERDQSALTNEAALLGAAVARLQAEFDAAKRCHEEVRRLVELDYKKMRDVRDGTVSLLEEKRKAEPNFQLRIPALDRELREVQKSYADLLQVTPQTPQVRQGLSSMRERMVAIPNEKSDLRTQYLRSTSEIRDLEERLARKTALFASAGKRLSDLDATWTAQAEMLAREMEAKKTERADVERRIDLLEKDKSNPYQRIGQVLAESKIAPVNQPESLECVLRLQVAIRFTEKRRAELEKAAATENAKELQKSRWLWTALLAVLCLVLLALAR